MLYLLHTQINYSDKIILRTFFRNTALKHANKNKSQLTTSKRKAIISWPVKFLFAYFAFMTLNILVFLRNAHTCYTRIK